MKGLSPRAQRLMVALAQDEARKFGSEQLLPEHVLLALLKSGDGLGYVSLQMLHLNVLTLQLELEQHMPVHAPITDSSDLPLSHRLRTMLDVAAVESRNLHTEYIGTEHLLLAAIREDQSVTWRYFNKAEIPIEQIRTVVADVEKKIPSSAKTEGMQAAADALFQNITPSSKQVPQLADGSTSAQQKKKDQNSILAQFSRDLTAQAREGNDDPVCRAEKKKSVVSFRFLSRRTKNNPVLIGEPGVGKDGNCGRACPSIIAKGDVPRDLLKETCSCQLDLAAASFAGTKIPWWFEERMKKLMKEVSDSKRLSFFFIDELFTTIIGAGGPEGSMGRKATCLKPAAEFVGELQVHRRYNYQKGVS